MKRESKEKHSIVIILNEDRAPLMSMKMLLMEGELTNLELKSDLKWKEQEQVQISTENELLQETTDVVIESAISEGKNCCTFTNRVVLTVEMHWVALTKVQLGSYPCHAARRCLL